MGDLPRLGDGKLTASARSGVVEALEQRSARVYHVAASQETRASLVAFIVGRLINTIVFPVIVGFRH